MDTRQSIVDELRRRQGDETDEVFSRRIGISRPMWSMIRRGRRQPGVRTLQRIAATYGDLTITGTFASDASAGVKDNGAGVR